MLYEGFHSVHSANPPKLVFHQMGRQKVTMNIYPTILCRSGCCVNCAAIHKLRNLTKLTPLTTPCMLGYCNCSLGGESITNLRFSSSWEKRSGIDLPEHNMSSFWTTIRRKWLPEQGELDCFPMWYWGDSSNPTGREPWYRAIISML